jgi:hypothetical protein
MAADLDTINSTQTAGVQYLGQIYQALQAGQKLNFVPVPAAVGSNGTPGQVAATTGFLYLCVANNTWRRVALSTF